MLYTLLVMMVATILFVRLLTRDTKVVLIKSNDNNLIGNHTLRPGSSVHSTNLGSHLSNVDGEKSYDSSHDLTFI